MLVGKHPISSICSLPQAEKGYDLQIKTVFFILSKDRQDNTFFFKINIENET